MLAECNKAFEDFIGKLNRVKAYNAYKCFLGGNRGLEQKTFDEVSGPLFAEGFKWPFASRELWLKGRLVIPGTASGITLSGSSAVLSHSSVCSSVVYINGRKMLDEKWWTNTDLLLSDSLNPGDVFDVTICLRKIDGCAYFGLPQIFIDKLESVLFKIGSFFKTLTFLEKLIAMGEIHDKELVSVYEGIIARVPINLLKDEKTGDFVAYVTGTESAMQRFSPHLKKYCSYLVGHAHIDMNWLWDWQNTLDTARQTFSYVQKLLDQYSEVRFSQSQAVLYKAMEDNHPEVFQRIRKMVSEGRWEVTASTWAEGDLNMASGEALVRQLLYAKHYTREKFGVESRVCWCPDTFGHAASYPQILKKCGVDYYYFCRCGKDKPLFYWEGIDGSRVLAFNDPKGYNNVVVPDMISRFARPTAESRGRGPSEGGLADSHGAYHLKKVLFSYGVGNHGGGPTVRDVRNGLVLKDNGAYARIRFSGAQECFDDFKRETKDIPVIKGELNYVFEGCYTTHADIKKYNRQCENLLITAEIFASLASVFGFAYPHESLTEAWRGTCFNQFHDILCGSGIHVGYDYPLQLAEEAVAAARRTLSDATAHISSLISFPQDGNSLIPAVVFNPLSWARDDVVEIDLSETGRDYTRVQDISGNQVPSQVAGDKLFFIARAVPSMGYKTYFLRRNMQPAETREPKPAGGGGLVFENSRYLLEVGPSTGVIKRLVNKGHGKNLVDLLEPCNAFKLYREKEHNMSAWDIGAITSVESLAGNTKVTGVTRGEVADIIETECVFARSRITQQMMFFKELDRIEFRTRLSWHELGTPETGIPMLRVSFPMGVNAPAAVHAIPFGALERPNNGQEAPALMWLDYSDGKFGMTLLNDCKYGHKVQGNNVELTIVRSPYEPDLNPDAGEHSFCYALCPHEGDWKDADAARKGHELNMPLIPVLARGNKTRGDGRTLPLEKAFVEVDAKNIFISCLKRAEDSRGLVLHSYDSEGRETRANFSFGWDIDSPEETNLIEDAISPVQALKNKVSCEFKKWEIKSHRVMQRQEPGR